MMSHFNVKSLTFYAIAIGSVVTLFSVVSRYGEKNLHAPVNISGRYLISPETLPQCQNADHALVLNIQQSGVYLHGSLLSQPAKNSSTNAALEEKQSLSGEWQNQQIVLAGDVPRLPACLTNAAPASGDRPIPVMIRGTVDQKTLTGELQLSALPTRIAFTAKQAPAPNDNTSP